MHTFYRSHRSGGVVNGLVRSGRVCRADSREILKLNENETHSPILGFFHPFDFILQFGAGTAYEVDDGGWCV